MQANAGALAGKWRHATDRVCVSALADGSCYALLLTDTTAGTPSSGIGHGSKVAQQCVKPYTANPNVHIYLRPPIHVASICMFLKYEI